MHRSIRFYVSFFALSMLSSTAVRAQGDLYVDGHSMEESVLASGGSSGEFGSNGRGGEEPTPVEDDNLSDGSNDQNQIMTWINGLASVGSAAWPTVRAYIWESCFAGNELFAGYAHSVPGNETGDMLTFQLLIEREAWRALDAKVRQDAMYRANELFTNRLAELNLEGKLAIVLIGR